MNPSRFIFITLFFVLSSLCFAEDEYSQSFGEYRVDYNIFPSTFLDPDIARHYGLKRSKYESLINVFVSREGQKGGLSTRIQGQVKNLMGQARELNFKEIREENTVYYLAPIKVTSEEVVHFDIQCTPEGDEEMLHVKFTRKLYPDSP